MTTSPSELSSLESLGGWPAVLGLLRPGLVVPDKLIAAALGEILEGRAQPSQIAAFALGLRARGETVAELSAALTTMLRFGVEVHLTATLAESAVDTCGTGGDRSGTFNVSTTAAFVVAGAGVPVCKHGGRAASSQTGSADVLEALGVNVELGPEAVARCVDEAGIGFCFAPRYHPAMRFAAPTRRELGVATLFNILGPMANPARVRHQVVGVADAQLGPLVAGVLEAQQRRRAVVVWGHDGLDELTTTTTSSMLIVEPGIELTEVVVDPSAFGFAPATVADLRGGDAGVNAAILRGVLEGRIGAHRNIVLLNAGAALLAGGAVTTLADGVVRAEAAIDDGSAIAALERLITLSTELTV